MLMKLMVLVAALTKVFNPGVKLDVGRVVTLVCLIFVHQRGDYVGFLRMEDSLEISFDLTLSCNIYHENKAICE